MSGLGMACQAQFFKAALLTSSSCYWRRCLWTVAANASEIGGSHKRVEGHRGHLQRLQLEQVRGKAKRVARGRDSLLNKFMRNQEKKKSTKLYEVWDGMSVSDLARVLDRPIDLVLDVVLSLPGAEDIESEREPIRNNQLITEFGKKMSVKFKFVRSPAAKIIKELELEEDLDVKVEPIDPADLTPRPPVVAIMGHVDHGKTTLLDYLRKSRIVEGEFGGITQHIGAFSVTLPGSEDRKVTFVDTPGHAAFKNMRSRGARTTDIVVLVVDASEGVKEQTLESVRMIKQAGTPMIVALNKIDRPGADVEATKKQLKEEADVDLEDFGGDVQSVAISALRGDGVGQLIEALSALAEVLQLSADRKGLVEGVVLESTVKMGLGKSATILIQRGVLKKGALLVSGKCQAKVKKLVDDRDAAMKSAGPSEAVTVVGWKEVPSAGEAVNEVSSEKRAAEVVRWRAQQEQKRREKEELKLIEKQREEHRKSYMEYRMKKLEAGLFRPLYGRHDFHTRQKESSDSDKSRTLSMVVKADVDGSLEAILDCLETYDSESEPVELDLMDFGVGDVTENDLVLAGEFGGVVYAFNTNVPAVVARRAVEVGVEIKEFNVIYHMVDDLKSEINARMPYTEEEEVVAKAEVQQEFRVSVKKRGKVPVAGCVVRSGTVQPDLFVKVVSEKGLKHEGRLSSVRHMKEEVERVEQGKECGLMVEDSGVRFAPGDVIVCFKKKTVPQLTKWTGF